jgi:hypothetical protein
MLLVALISPVVPEALVPTPKEPNLTLDVVATAWAMANEIEPAPLVMVTPVPAVRVALVKVLPVVLPISN